MEYLSNAFVCKQWQRFHSVKLHQYYVMDDSLPIKHVDESNNVLFKWITRLYAATPIKKKAMK